MTKNTTKLLTTGNVPAVTPKLSATRQNAFDRIAQCAYDEGLTRGEAIANARIALGSKPSEAEVRAAKDEATIGRLASRLPKAMVPKGSNALAFARVLIVERAAFGTEKALRTGQTGRRTQAQEKLVGAARQYTSTFFAELNLSAAKTNAQKNAEKAAAARAPSPAGSGKGEQDNASPDEGKPLAMSGHVYAQHMLTQMGQLVAFDDKYASHRPVPEFSQFSEAIRACKAMAIAGAAAYGKRMDALAKKPAPPRSKH